MNAFERSPFLIPISIVIAGLLVAGAVVYAPQLKEQGGGDTASRGDANTQRGRASAAAEKVRPIDKTRDHLLGHPDAPVKIIEFSDTECPFCKRFHGTMHGIADEYGQAGGRYGDVGAVVWAYRHFPLEGLHRKARTEAEATECANELGGATAFWAYLDRLFEITPSNDGLDPAELPRIAEHVGLNRAAFEQCLASGTHAPRVAADLEDAVQSGGEGTPYSVVVAPNGKTFTIPGALPYEEVRQIIEAALRDE
ncbi:MAG: thioredoxin domain-containing protein [Candidatus Colwellbacteria bacterium]|nr:thioredoxin domain-containing protein [Candidatus Colwellbacteria bacterium]